MEGAGLLREARHAAGISQEELARRAHTSRPTLSAYEHGRKSPTLATAERLFTEAGYHLAVEPLIAFTSHPLARGRLAWVPNGLPRLPVRQALATVSLPLRLNWSQPGRVFELADRSDRARVYELVLIEGSATDVLAYVDGALLIDLWDELVLPRDVRRVWAPLVATYRPLTTVAG